MMIFLLWDFIEKLMVIVGKKNVNCGDVWCEVDCEEEEEEVVRVRDILLRESDEGNRVWRILGKLERVLYE